MAEVAARVNGKAAMADVHVAASVASNVTTIKALSKTATPEQIKQAWDSNEKIRAEYTTFEGFSALVRRWGVTL